MTSTASATTTLAELTEQSGLGVLDHLDTALTIPVTAGLQAQGDLLVVPWRMVAAAEARSGAPTTPTPVPPTGIESSVAPAAATRTPCSPTVSAPGPGDGSSMATA